MLSKHSLSVLVRGEDKVAVFEKMGVKAILFNSLEETELLQKLASEHDSESLPKSLGNSATDPHIHHQYGLWLPHSSRKSFCDRARRQEKANREGSPLYPRKPSTEPVQPNEPSSYV